MSPRSKLTLNDIPLDAEYVGRGPMFVWSPTAHRWVDCDLAATYQFQRRPDDVGPNVLHR